MTPLCSGGAPAASVKCELRRSRRSLAVTSAPLSHCGLARCGWGCRDNAKPAPPEYRNPGVSTDEDDGDNGTMPIHRETRAPGTMPRQRVTRAPRVQYRNSGDSTDEDDGEFVGAFADAVRLFTLFSNPLWIVRILDLARPLGLRS